MSEYEDARRMSGGRKPVMGDESHINDIYTAIGKLQVPVADKKAYDMASNAGNYISGALMSHRSGDPKTAWMKADEASKVVTTLANHLMLNHGVSTDRALYAGGHARQHVLDYGDTVEQQRDDEFRNGGNY